MKKCNRTLYTVLGMLTIKPMSGYEIAKAVRNSTSFFWSESEGQIYPALKECVKLSLATCQEASQTENTRAKKIYKITPQGKKELTAWLSEKVQPALVRNELLLKLFFGKNTNPKECIHHLIQYEKENQSLLKIYKNLELSLKSEYKDSPHLIYWLITLDFGIKITHTELKWTRETITLLEKQLA